MRKLRVIFYIIFLSALISFIVSLKYSPSFYNTKGKFYLTLANLKFRFQAFIYNLKLDLNPPRKRKTSFIVEEAKLSTIFNEPFKSFSKKDWNKFWDLIYEPAYKIERGVKIKYYRSKKEIEQYLKWHYPERFRSLTQEGWDYFWQLVAPQQ